METLAKEPVRPFDELVSDLVQGGEMRIAGQPMVIWREGEEGRKRMGVELRMERNLFPEGVILIQDIEFTTKMIAISFWCMMIEN